MSILASYRLKRRPNKPSTKDHSFANMRLFVQLEWYVRPIELESYFQTHERTPIKAFDGKRWRRKHCLPIPVKVLKYKDADYLIVRS